MQIDVLLNRQPSADPLRAEAGGLAVFERSLRDSRYQPGDLLEKVYSSSTDFESMLSFMAFDMSDREDGDEPDHFWLEYAYVRCNHGSSLTFPDYRHRSLSCGDVVVLDNQRAFACESVGWSPVELG